MKRIHPAYVLALIALMFTMSVQCADERMRTGLWEVSTSFEKQVAPVRNMCYTPAMVQQANLPEKTMQEDTERMVKKGGCTLKSFKMEGNRLSMTTACPDSSTATVSTYSGDVFETVATLTEAGVSKVTRIKGRRIGDCK